MTQFFAKDPIFIILGALGAIEQIFYYFPGSFVYKSGFRINTIVTQNLNIAKNVPYYRDVYPFGVIAPLLFVGQSLESNIIVIRAGWFSFSFFLYLAISPIFTETSFMSLANSLCIVFLIVFMFERLKRKIYAAG